MLKNWRGEGGGGWAWRVGQSSCSFHDHTTIMNTHAAVCEVLT
jgi:hypothetical protein